MEMIQKTFNQPDETRNFPNGQLNIIKLADSASVSIGQFNPGWHWAESVKPIAKTETCQVTHRGYILSGRLHIEMEDGSATELRPNDAYIVPPGHDAWVVGDEPCVVIEFADMSHYAKR